LRQPDFWINRSYRSGDCQFIKDAYHVRETQPHTFVSCAGAFSFSNFAFEVEMTIVQGDCGGALFRSDSIKGKYYKFSICRNGTFTLFKYMDDTGKNTQALVPMRDYSAIKRGMNETNVIAVVAKGEQITLFINKQQAVIVQDGSLEAGCIELIAANDSSGTEVVFQNMKIWTV
jgi:hypothetical protein